MLIPTDESWTVTSRNTLTIVSVSWETKKNEFEKEILITVKRIMGTTLVPCGANEWQWVESEEMEDPGENYDGDIAQWLEDNVTDWSDVMIIEGYTGGIHNLRDGVILGYLDGTPHEMYWVEETPARISLNNSGCYDTIDEMAPGYLRKEGVHWEAIVNAMDPEIREAVHRELAPCEPVDFLRRYLELATQDLCVG